MNTQATPINQPRSPLATGSPEQKVRFDAAEMALKNAHVSMTTPEVMDLVVLIETGELPEDDQ